ncbi:hypothetical protein H6792_03610 [Candidatus Nomurabacteria bacterium]|nr:hypothetical protein [Candidatus Nomurabacteria bacterium]
MSEFGRGNRENGYEVTIQHYVPFDWGTLYVSEGAGEMSGLIPLTASARDGDNRTLSVTDSGNPPVDSVFGLPIDVYFMSPEELPPNQDLVTVHQNKEGIAINIALPFSKVDLESSVDGFIQTITEDLDVNPEDFVSTDGIPLSEVAAEGTQEFTIDFLCRKAIVPEVIKAFIERITTDTDNSTLRRATNLGAVGLVSAGAMLGINTLSGGRVDVVEVTASMVYMTWFNYKARGILKRHFKEAGIRQQAINNLASRYATQIGWDIYRTYSPEYFNQSVDDTTPDND